MNENDKKELDKRKGAATKLILEGQRTLAEINEKKLDKLTNDEVVEKFDYLNELLSRSYVLREQLRSESFNSMPLCKRIIQTDPEEAKSLNKLGEECLNLSGELGTKNNLIDTLMAVERNKMQDRDLDAYMDKVGGEMRVQYSTEPEEETMKEDRNSPRPH